MNSPKRYSAAIITFGLLLVLLPLHAQETGEEAVAPGGAEPAAEMALDQGGEPLAPSEPEAFESSTDAQADTNPEATPVVETPASYNPEAEPVAESPAAYNSNVDVLPEGEVAAAAEAAQDSLLPPLAEPSEVDRGAESLSLTVTCKDGQVCREKATGLPFRVLPRSFSNVYKEMSADADMIAVANVRAFFPLYVFSREGLDLSDPAEPKGWYQVAQSVQGPAMGWMQATDVLEWKQALIVAYTHPGVEGEERQRVLMFRTLEDLRQIVESDIRSDISLFLYDNVANDRVPASLASKEPERYVDIDQSFYILPIVDFEGVDLDGDDARYLRLAAAVPQQRGADTLDDEAYAAEAKRKGEMTEEMAKTLGIDIVFVMDMTRSMQPYIDRTKEAIAGLARSIATPEVKDKLRFGLVGYRDSVELIPALKYTTHNFTPELVDVDGFLQILEKEAKATRIGSVDYPEEVFAGVNAGLSSAWDEDYLRFMFLVGDASSHAEGHKQNTTGKDANVLHLTALDKNVRILAFHLLDPRMPDDYPIAKAQFSALSRTERGDADGLVQIDTEKPEQLSDAMNKAAGLIFEVMNKLQSGGSLQLAGAGQESGQNEEERVGDQARRKMQKLVSEALVEYLGKEAKPPKDILVWALDRDLTNPAIQSLDVRVLITKAQLSDMITAMDGVISAMARAKVTQMQFFEALQEVSGQTLKNPDALDVADKLGDAGLLPAFISSLPYHSEILTLNDDMFAAMTAEQRAVLESSLRAKMRQYRDINEQVDGWVQLNEIDEDSQKIYPLRLDYLP